MQRRGPLTDIRNPLMAELLVRVRAGATVTEVCKQPDMPTHHTLLAWKRRYPIFDEALAEARRVGKDRRRWRFDEARAEAFFVRLRAGEGVREILSSAGAPINPRLYQYWRRTEGAFAEEAHRLITARRRGMRRRVPTPFDRGVADRIVVAIGAGLKVSALGPATGFPSNRIVWRWRREQPEFDMGVRIAVKVRRRRAALGRGPGEALLVKILDRVREGESLHRLCKRREMPSETTLRDWRKLDPALDRELDQARWERGDAWSDRVLELSETPARALANRREVRTLMRRLGRLEAWRARMDERG